MLVQCNQCGAPLDVGSAATHVVCAYCRTKQRLRSLTVQQPITPPAWQPPPVWQPPPAWQRPGTPWQAPLVYDPSVYAKQGNRMVLAWMGVIVLLGTLSSLVGGLGQCQRTSAPTASTPPKPAAGARDDTPARDDTAGGTVAACEEVAARLRKGCSAMPEGALATWRQGNAQLREQLAAGGLPRAAEAALAGACEEQLKALRAICGDGHTAGNHDAAAASAPAATSLLDDPRRALATLERRLGPDAWLYGLSIAQGAAEVWVVPNPTRDPLERYTLRGETLAGPVNAGTTTALDRARCVLPLRSLEPTTVPRLAKDAVAAMGDGAVALRVELVCPPSSGALEWRVTVAVHDGARERSYDFAGRPIAATSPADARAPRPPSTPTTTAPPQTAQKPAKKPGSGGGSRCNCQATDLMCNMRCKR